MVSGQSMFSELRRIPHYLRKAPKKLKLAYRSLRSPYFRSVEPGHFYSPFPDMEEMERRTDYIYPPTPSDLAGLNLSKSAHEELLTKFESYYSQLPFERTENPNCRYYRPNESFPFQDAFALYAMIRHLKPKRFIEVGCGNSSSVILDTCEVMKINTQLTFIEPYPEPLFQKLRLGDRDRFKLIVQCIQDVPLETFTQLEANDVLFIDTSHVSKIGSDVNHIFFHILPHLAKGVQVHFHDIWYPFEYPKHWLHGGSFWNEAYLLRAFLMFNPAFEITMFNSYVFKCLPERVNASFPLFLEGPGASLWLRRT